MRAKWFGHGLAFAPASSLAGAFLSLALLGQAEAAARKPNTDAGNVVADLAALADMKPRACAGVTDGVAPAAWRADPPLCAWRGLLQMRRWHANAGAGCLSVQAQWWAWARERGPSRGVAAWVSTWQANSMADRNEQRERVALIARDGDGWTATEWTWVPSLRPPTRQWQAARWQRLRDAAQALRPATGPGPASTEIRMLMASWEANLRGRAADLDNGLWRWQSEGVCLAVDAVGLSESQLHMPYASDESRLEQRSAMQLLLARRFPQALWVTPFRLLPQSGPGGAKYEALWREGNLLRGQLWVPRKGDGAVVRLRIATMLPADGSKAAREALADRAAHAIDRELTGIAASWTAAYER